MEKDLTAIHPAYETIESVYIEEVHGTAGLLRHKKTGANVVIISNDDTNKVFAIGFRTPPKDSTGVAHIIEHTVLCGSAKFPSKDPFVELVKGSLNTFLNAMTYPDKTVYPIASYNDKDFQNLMHVYLDAVFYPNIYKNKNIFLQEGWHYELSGKDGELTYNGVVYNEMKGAFSAPEQILIRKITQSLFPDTTYGVESGGDPQFIPELTYEQFLDFHRKYYHPSNSYIYLYGDMDMTERLDFMDREYLSAFDRQPADSEIKKQPAPEKMGVFHEKYPISADEDSKDKNYFAYSTVIGESLDEKLYLAFQILDYVLMGAPGAILKKALIDAGLAKDVFGSYDNGIYQPYYSIVAKDAGDGAEHGFMEVITETLQKAVKDGLNKKSLEAAINYYEFRFREADFGRYPKGLMYGLQMFDSWLYDASKPFIHLQAYKTFEYLRQQLHTDYFERLIETYLLNNPHASLLILKPEKGLTLKEEQAVREKLAAYKASLSDDQLEALVRESKALKVFQETPSTKEELEKIPMITIGDIKKEAEPLCNEEDTYEEIHVLKHCIETNGIGYFKWLFSMDSLPDELIAYAGLLTNILGNVDTKKHTYGELTDEINMYTGGIVTDITVFRLSGDTKKYMPKFIVSGKALYEQIHVLSDLMRETVFDSVFEDSKRLREIIGQIRSRLSMYFAANGHLAASLRASAYYSEASAYRDRVSGIEFYDFIKTLDEHFDELQDEIKAKLYETGKILFRKENLLADMTADENGIKKMAASLPMLAGQLYTEPVRSGSINYMTSAKNEAFVTAGMVQFDAVAGNFMDKGFKYHGALQCLKVIMNYDYLWNEIRVKGGAYGCMCSFGSSGDAYFVTYRDPNLTNTYEVFKKAGEYIRHFECSARDMTKYIIGAVSNIDTPLNPSSKGARSLSYYLSGVSYEQLMQSRLELLNATVEDIRSFGDLIDAFVNENYICVVGSESQIKANETMFGKVRQL